MTYRVELDPGHGGRWPGAVNRQTGLQEKEVVLPSALRVRDLFYATGIEVFMTRDTDMHMLNTRLGVISLNDKHKAIRQSIRDMTTKRAREYLEAIGLPEMEFRAIYDCDVLQRPLDVVADEMAVSERTLKRLRERAYGRIVALC